MMPDQLTSHPARLLSLMLLVIGLLGGLLVVPAGAATDGFTDVPASHTFNRDVTALARAGITRGCNPPDNSRFCPDATVTRGQMAAFLTRALDLPAGTTTFDDTRGHLFATPIAALARAGITRGCGSGDFCPDTAVTRGQMAAFLTRAGLTTGAAPAETGSRASRTATPTTTSSTPPAPRAASAPAPAPVRQVDTGSFDGPVVGAQVHATWSHYDDEQRARVLDQLASAGITSIRVDMGWAAIEERCSGCVSQWYVDIIDRTIEQAAARGIDVLGMLWYSPSWATDGGPTSPPDDPAEYARVAGWMAERFAGRVAAWQLWNEPDLDSYFDGTIEEYVSLVRAAAPAIKAADPTTPVVLGGPSHNDTPWLREVLGHGVGDLVDVIAVQPYHLPSDQSPSMPDTAAGDPGRFLHLETVIDVVNEFAPGTPVWLTEFGWSTHANRADTPIWERGVTRQQQAAFTVEALQLLEERFPQVERAYLYRALDRDKGSPHQDNFGLLDTQGRPKPVIAALRDLLVP